MSILTHLTRGKIRIISLGGMCIASLAIISQSVFADNGIRLISINSKNYVTFFEDGGSFLGVDANSFHDKTNNSWIAHPDTGYNYLRDMTFFGDDDLSAFTASGYLGIGTTTPDAKLEVSGGDAIINGLTVGRGGGQEASNVAFGNNALDVNTFGWDNLAIGYMSLGNNTEGSENVAIGNAALGNNTIGNANVAIGRSALGVNISGGVNTAVGYSALINNSTGQGNTAVGSSALEGSNGDWNSAFGHLALPSNSTGVRNTGIGFAALQYLDTGSNNSALGTQAGYNITTWNGGDYFMLSGSLNTFLGAYSNYADAAVGITNATAVGAYAQIAQSNTVILGSGANVGIGTSTPGAKLDVVGNIKITDGTEGVGKVLTSDASGLATWETPSGGGGGCLVSGDPDNSICLGSGALASNWGGFSNTAIGTTAMYSNTSGEENVALGFESLYSNNSGFFNTAVGVESLKANTFGAYNTAIGKGSLRYNNSGSRNTALGYNALNNNTTGNFNTAVGVGTLGAAIGWSMVGSNNTAIGTYALNWNTTGENNTAIGSNSISENGNTGWNNTTLGAYSLYNNTTGWSNTAIGQGALYGNWTGSGNVAVGFEAINAPLTTSFQTAVGYQALRNTTTGTQNLALGYRAGSGITTGSNNIAIGYDAQVPSGTSSNQLNIGNWIYGDGGNIGIGTSTGTAKLTIAGQVAITGGSPGAGKVLTSDASGLATWETPTSGGTSGGGGSIYAYATTGAVSTTIIAASDIPSLTSDELPVGSYAFKSVIKFRSSATTNGIALTLSQGTATLTNFIGEVRSQRTAILNDPRSFSTPGTLVVGTAVVAANTDYFSMIEGTFTVTATGTVKVQFASEVATNTTTVQTGSYLMIQPLITVIGGTSGGGGGETVCPGSGTDNTCYGSGALASNTTGGNNTANGAYALYSNTEGWDNIANGVQALYSNTIGSVNIANGVQALYSNTEGSQNIAIGNNALSNSESGWYNIALGTYALAQNQYGSSNIGIGADALNSNITGQQNVGIGQSALWGVDLGQNNTAIGFEAGNGSDYYSSLTGSNNTFLGASTKFLTANIGITNSTAVGANVVLEESNTLILGSGANVGIGTSTPGAKLEVAGGIKVGYDGGLCTPDNDGTLRFDGTSFTYCEDGAGWSAFGGGGGGVTGGQTGYIARWLGSTTLGTGSLYDTGTGVGIGTATPSEKLHVVGNVLAVDFLYTSDRRLKKDILPLENSLEKILKLKGYTFSWLSDGQPNIGIIAQEVEAVYPSLVHTDPTTGMKSVQYGNLVAPLIEAVKEQQEMIESQKNEIQALTERLERLETLLQ